jgi:hypothetical protein
MSSTEITAVDQSEVTRLMAVLQGGGDLPDETIKVPFLKVQYDSEDQQGRDVKRGSFTLSGFDNPVYAETVKIRVLAQHYQYRESDPNTYKIVNKTILMDDMLKREPRDMKGGLRCGRPDGKTLKQLSEDDQAMWRKRVVSFRILRGVVTLKGKTADGDAVTLENQPFQMFLKGMNFMPFEKTVLQALKPLNKKMSDVWIDVKTSKAGKAFNIEFDIDHKTKAVMDTDTLETMRVFYGMAKQENERIEASYHKAHQEANEMDSAIDAIDSVVIDDLESDLD